MKHLLQEYSEARCAVAIGVSRRSDKRSDGVLAGLAAFAAGHYREAERRYWQVLERRPGERTARVFLAESLLAQQRFEEATDVLDGLERSRVEDTALRYARALRIGLERGLYRSRPSVGSEIAFSAGDAAAAVVARRDHSPQYERSLR